MRRNYMSLAVMMLALGIALGAFGAHGLEGRISDKYADVWETASRYWIYSALTIIGLVNFIINENHDHVSLKIYGKFGALRMFVLGSFLFSFSLWMLSLNEILGTNLKKLGIVTPFGGTIMIISLMYIGMILYRINRVGPEK